MKCRIAFALMASVGVVGWFHNTCPTPTEISHTLNIACWLEETNGNYEQVCGQADHAANPHFVSWLAPTPRATTQITAR